MAIRSDAPIEIPHPRTSSDAKAIAQWLVAHDSIYGVCDRVDLGRVEAEHGSTTDLGQ